MSDEKKTLETKIVILGHSGVGKTSMVNRYVRGQFLTSTTATIGAAFMKKTLLVDDWRVVLQIWDTAGQERFRSMAPMYYRGAHAAILVFDATDRESFDKVGSWVDELQSHANTELVLVLVANKSDLVDSSSPSDSVVTFKEGSAFANSINAPFFQTSAKTGKGIEDLFHHVARALVGQEMSLRKQGKTTQPRSYSHIVPQDDDNSSANKKSKCCSSS